MLPYINLLYQHAIILSIIIKICGKIGLAEYATYDSIGIAKKY